MTKKTCLNDAHRELNAKMVEFGGFDMPLEYSGIVDEHNAVRNNCGVFDVSHMGEVLVSGNEATKFVDHIFTNDASALATGQIAYGMMLHENGGTVDDLLVYRVAESIFLLVINAANIDKDVAHIKAVATKFDVTVDNVSDDCAQLAVQGPQAEHIVTSVLGLDAGDLKFYTFKVIESKAGKILVSRTGYTGEDGFEIYAAPAIIVGMWKQLMDADVTPCGLGCRDTLRFEAGLPLYGDELADDISPVEACLSMFVKLDKPGGFIGVDAVRRQKAEGATRKLVGLELQGPAIARHGYEVATPEGEIIGAVTTGYRSITLGKSIATALVDSRYAKLDTPLAVHIRRRVAPAVVVKKRFYTPQYKK